jgi:lipopolysaccharide/colanic/teichoic acid biosynthesis glycosyltransferase
MTRRQSKFSQQFKQLIYWIVAFLLLIVQIPVILATAILIYIYSPGAIFSRQWHIGSRGKLFRLLKFRTTVVNDDFRSAWLVGLMCKYNVDKLPELFNVLRGDISLKDLFYPLTLSEALRLSLESEQ